MVTHCSHVHLFVTERTVVHQALSMEFSRQVYWTGLPCPLQGIFPTQRLNPGFPHCRWILYHLSHQGSPLSMPWDNVISISVSISLMRKLDTEKLSLLPKVVQQGDGRCRTWNPGLSLPQTMLLAGHNTLPLSGAQWRVIIIINGGLPMFWAISMCFMCNY